jgi:hypothetical protein
VLKISELKSDHDLIWTRSDTDLLELIIGLYEQGAIQNETKNLTQKDAIKAFSELFGKEIKDPYKKLNAARARKKEEVVPFLVKLQNTLEDYHNKQESKDR